MGADMPLTLSANTSQKYGMACQQLLAGVDCRFSLLANNVGRQNDDVDNVGRQ